MNQKIIKRKEYVDPKTIEEFSSETGFDKHISEFLLSYGLKAKDVPDFITPDEKNLTDPFLFLGMDKLVQRLKEAAEQEQTVVVYGDYDADGICAAAILSLYLAQIGINVYTHIPSRKSGYGLRVESLEKIIEDTCPDLILTCDCGISACDEVKYVLDLGVDIIITDHHEVGSTIPECVVVNAKQADCPYPFKMLCGAGVALKVVQAMGGIEEALNYMDIAAVATIADLVPLTGENRLIVQLGLKALQEGGNLGLKSLIESQKIVSPSSVDITFKIVPRINAAGRMSDAYRAFELITTDDRKKIIEIINDIEQDNIKRRNICDEIYGLALQTIKDKKLLSRYAIVLSSTEWDKGVVGIVAARLTEDFDRPCMLIVKSGDIYKGTARSIEGINVYELLTQCSDLLVEYGGHNQAAGFSISEENIEEFAQRVNNIVKSYDRELFLPGYFYDLEMDSEELDIKFVEELCKLEPFGNGFCRPIIKIEADKLKLGQTKSGFYSATIENGQLISFNPYNINYLVGSEKKYLFVEAELSFYGNQQSVRGIIKNVVPENLYINDEVASANKIYALKNLTSAKKVPEMFDASELKTIIGDDIYGTVIVASDRTEYEKFFDVLNEISVHEFYGPSTINNVSRVIVSPGNLDKIAFGIDKLIFLSTPPDMSVLPISSYDGKLYMCSDKGDYKVFNGLSVLRKDFALCYDYFRKAENKRYVSSYACYKSLNGDNAVSYDQFVFCLCVFEELNLLKITEENGFSVSLINGNKKALDSSVIYNFICKYNK